MRPAAGPRSQSKPLQKYARGGATKTFPKNALSCIGYAGLRPQPMAGDVPSSHSAMCFPVVFTCAIRQAETFSWQPVSHAPFFHSGATPIIPAKVYETPF